MQQIAFSNLYLLNGSMKTEKNPEKIEQKLPLIALNYRVMHHLKFAANSIFKFVAAEWLNEIAQSRAK